MKRGVAAVGMVLLAGCGESADRPPGEAIPALKAVTKQWAACFEDEGAVGKIKSVVVESDTTITLESGEVFVVKKGSSRSEPANTAAERLADDCGR